MFYVGAVLVIRSIVIVSPSTTIADLFNGRIFVDIAGEYIPYFLVIASGIIVSLQRPSRSVGISQIEKWIVLLGATMALCIFLANSFAPFHVKQP